ncbi:hypothetical protein T03_10379 [Trichinella britovi]|uniref:Uncharacterized protein n=1 Tax=Trichinella britovi TaxID=45882 RepID=A0A0V1CK00_TRIBR|nr:hypothetical protein T03_10379 [Trichinella britovi]
MLTKTITANASRTKIDTPAVEPISTRIKPGSASRSSPSPTSLGASGSSWTSTWERDELKRPNSFLDESNSTAELTFGPSRIQRCHRCWFEDNHRPMSTEKWTMVVVLSVDCKSHKPEAFSHQLTFLGSTIRPGVVSVQPPQTQWPASEWSRDEKNEKPIRLINFARLTWTRQTGTRNGLQTRAFAILATECGFGIVAEPQAMLHRTLAARIRTRTPRLPYRPLSIGGHVLMEQLDNDEYI